MGIYKNILALILVLSGYSVPVLASEGLRLEKELWTAEADAFAKLEAEIIRKMQRDPESAYCHYLLASLYLRKFMSFPLEERWLERATSLAKQIIYLNPNSELGYLALASVYDAIGEVDKAKEVFQIFTYRTTIKRSWRYFLAKAKIFLSEDSLDSSLALLKKSLMTKGALVEVVIPYVIVLLDAKYDGEQEHLILAIATWQKDIPHHLFDQYLAAIHMESGKYRLAYSLYTKLLKDNPRNYEARRNRAIISYRHMQRYQEALDVFAVLLSENDISPVEAMVINMHMAMVYLVQKKEKPAREHFLEAILVHPSGDVMLEFVIATYAQSQKYQELAKLLEQLNLERPGNSLYYSLLGDILTEHIKDYQRAVSAYESAIVLDPHSGRLYAALGMAHYHLQEFNQALQMFGKARDLDTSDASSFYNEACVYALLSREKEAVVALRRAIELDESLKDYAKEDADFDKIRALPAFTDVLN